MPVAKSSPTGRTAAIVGVAGVIAAIGLIALISVVAGRSDVEVRLGDDRFPLGSAEARAESIAEDGPTIYSDVASGDRDIYVQHLGEDPAEGWLAFAASPPGKARDCFLRWQAEQEEFTYCYGETYPADGGDLPSYPVEVTEDGELFVDLNAEEREATTTTTDTTILETGDPE
ncbi:hypothetical protein BH24ACT3_BH24ACT3_01510 [soil metagenome]